MAINDNPFITRGNYKEFAFELLDDQSVPVYTLADAMLLEFVLQDLELNTVLRLSPPDSIRVNQNLKTTDARGWVTIVVNSADSEALEVGMYRFAIQARWATGRVHEWTFPNVFYVMRDIITT